MHVAIPRDDLEALRSWHMPSAIALRAEAEVEHRIAGILQQQKIDALEQAIAEAPSVAYVYVIAAGDQAVKIGVATDPQRRLQGNQTGNHEQLRLVYAIPTMDPYGLERRLHDRFSDYHIRGEWFRPEVLDGFIEAIATDLRLDA